MTLLPTETWSIKGAWGRKLKVGPRCSNPSCGKLAEHAHHMFPRSFLKGVYDWVEMPDGSVWGNLTALCSDCHDDITGRIGGHRAAIRVHRFEQSYVFVWCRVKSNGEVLFLPVAPIDPQPPTGDSPVASPATSSRSEACPTCGQVKPAKRSSPALPDGERRRRKSWTIKVPDDVEDGAYVLDTLVDDLAPSLGHHPDRDGRFRSARYFVIVPAVVFAQQHREQFVKEVRG